MKDKIVLALAGLPSMGNHGGAQTCYGIIQALRKQYDIHVISLYEPGQYSKDKKENEKLLNNLKIKISYINKKDQLKNFNKRLVSIILDGKIINKSNKTVIEHGEIVKTETIVELLKNFKIKKKLLLLTN